jgi:hypothetical protein
MNHLTKQLVSNLTRVLRRYFRSVDYLAQRDQTIDACARALEFAETPQNFSVGALVADPPLYNAHWMPLLYNPDWEESSRIDLRGFLHLIRFCSASDVTGESTVLLLVPPTPSGMSCSKCPEAQWALHRAALRAFNTAWPKRLLHPEIIGDHGMSADEAGLRAVVRTWWNPHYARVANKAFTDEERLIRATTERLRARDEEYTSVFRMQLPNRSWIWRPELESRITNPVLPI